MCKVIAICNQKGGVSKTTTTANLGVGLVRAGKKVLVIDADPQGNLSQCLGIENPDELEVALPSIMEQIIMDKEVDVTKGIIHHKEGLDLMPLMLRGAQVQKYGITNEISQGDIIYLRKDAYLMAKSNEKSRHHERRRIVLQGITGINEKWRLKMTMAQPPYFCANSVNYLLLPMYDRFDYYILGLLNSKLLNWYFSKLSTNSNVNGYEIDALPIKLGDENQKTKIIDLVDQLLQNGNDINAINQIDNIVYDIYNISEYEIPIIEN